MLDAIRVVDALGFPREAYESTERAIVDYGFRRFRRNSPPISNQERAAWKQFDAGFRGIAFRYQAMHISQGELLRNLVMGQQGPMTVEKEFRQDQALAHWVSDGYSMFECLWYSIASLGSFLQLPSFPDFSGTQDGTRKIAASKLADWLQGIDAGTSGSEKLGQMILDFTKSEDYHNFKSVRNTLQHRSNPPKFTLWGPEGELRYSGFDGGHFWWVPGGTIPQPHTVSENFVLKVRVWMDLSLESLLRQMKSSFTPLLESNKLAAKVA